MVTFIVISAVATVVMIYILFYYYGSSNDDHNAALLVCLLGVLLTTQVFSFNVRSYNMIPASISIEADVVMFGMDGCANNDSLTEITIDGGKYIAHCKNGANFEYTSRPEKFEEVQ